METIIHAIGHNIVAATTEMFTGATCLYPFRWFRGEAVCGPVFPNPCFLFTLNYAFTHYVAFLLLAWSIPPINRMLCALLGFPPDRGAWRELFWVVLLFLLTTYGTAVSHQMTTVLAFTVVGRIGLLTTCLKVASAAAAARKACDAAADKREPLDPATAEFAKAKPWFLRAMGVVDGSTAVLTAWYLARQHGAGAVWVAVGGAVDMLAGSLLVMIPILARELDETQPRAKKDGISGVLEDQFKPSFWVTIFSALLLALGSYSVLVGAMGLDDFIPMTVPVRLLAAVFCVYGYVALRVASRKEEPALRGKNKPLNPWLLLVFGGAMIVLALGTAATMSSQAERSAAPTDRSCSMASSVATVTQRS
jgi:hypothetical protein